MNAEDDRENRLPETSAQWYVEADAGRGDAVSGAEFAAWLAMDPEHEAELERCEAAVFLAKKLGEQARVELAFDDAARLAAARPPREPRRSPWYTHAALAWSVSAVSLTVAALSVLDGGEGAIADRPAAASPRTEARYAIDLATSQPAVVLPGEVVVDARSVAVLPFYGVTASIGDVEAANVIAATLYEDVVRELAAIPGLYVVGRDAVRPYAERQVSTVETAAQLGVRGVIEARVGYADGSVRVELEYTDAAQSAAATRETYERPLEELAALPPDIVTDVGAVLDATLRTAERMAALQR